MTSKEKMEARKFAAVPELVGVEIDAAAIEKIMQGVNEYDTRDYGCSIAIYADGSVSGGDLLSGNDYTVWRDGPAYEFTAHPLYVTADIYDADDAAEVGVVRGEPVPSDVREAWEATAAAGIRRYVAELCDALEDGASQDELDDIAPDMPW